MYQILQIQQFEQNSTQVLTYGVAQCPTRQGNDWTDKTKNMTMPTTSPTSTIDDDDASGGFD